jgi:DNA helicase-2/ATP-dependent DNA helicase PcrA
MDVTEILAPLNTQQRAAVTSTHRTNLVLAGAGSGKTRVLVHRIAWALNFEEMSLGNILAVTFTNKAANEMRLRIQELISRPTRLMWIGTFHGIAHQLLRIHYEAAQLPPGFQILDTDDQLRIVKRIYRTRGLDESGCPPKQALWFINAQKERGLRSQDIKASQSPDYPHLLEIYREYEDICNRSGLVDFAELLLRSLELLQSREDILALYLDRFKHVLVDEFQDTNHIQYRLLQLLTRKGQNFFVVGDDDQSIYSWRGAQVENLFKFQVDHPESSLIRLEQNYRSTESILNVANALISNNDNRLGKTLWTNSNPGEPVRLYRAFNEMDEAYFVCDEIRALVNEGHCAREIAILYRSNAQSRQFEERLITFGIPYRVYGGLRFFERAEIKDALAYLRLLNNPHDDASFERVINTPPRGIGAKTIENIRAHARSASIPLWEAVKDLAAQKSTSPRNKNTLDAFVFLIESMIQDIKDLSLHEQVALAIERPALKKQYASEKNSEDEQRLENLNELVSAARQFSNEYLLENDEEMLNLFLSHASLEAGEGQADANQDCVQLMTLHSAKGLEFDQVYMVGLEEGLFPSQQSLEDRSRIEEERRLCYVGITRAKKRLVITLAEHRRIYGRDNYPLPSRFLAEIPSQLISEIRVKNAPPPAVRFPPEASIPGNQTFKIGQAVIHNKFGYGIITDLEGEGAQSRAQINFAEAGFKWLMLAYASLTLA